MNRTGHPEVALRDPAYPLKPLQDDISVTLEPMIIAKALPRLDIRAGEFNRRQRPWRQRHWCT
ncbi:helicase [Thalassococcus profundi]|uniref:Helicase n=1 Tax=Thalassococcus profundi TaxID=2282382 RepID=A0A369TJA0_9RHOB|nr:helicase [Thalassococcus profundi]